VATTKEKLPVKPVFRRGATKPNPRCFKPGHSSQRRESIQRHTCWTCFLERATELASNPHLTRWDVACMLAREFRNYFCSCCILEAYATKDFTTVCLNKYCRSGHKFICKQRRCTMHNRRLTVCTECPDPRAGTSYHFCGVRVSQKCNCKRTPGEVPQDPWTIRMKEASAEGMLRRAREMEAAGDVAGTTTTTSTVTTNSIETSTHSDN
jgi:hypothetical protein